MPRHRISFFILALALTTLFVALAAERTLAQNLPPEVVAYLELPFTRKGPDGKIWAPSQRLDRVVALKAATSWASEYVLRPEVLGTLETGKWADFLILNQDYFLVPEDDISEVRPLMTVVGGKTVYLDPGLANETGMEPTAFQPDFAK